MAIKLPPILYKYCSWDNKNHRRIITHCEIYFSSIEKFNDLFDSIAPIRYELDSEEETRKRLAGHFSNVFINPTPKQINSAVDTYISKGYHKQKSQIEISHGLQVIKRRKDFGIFSLSAYNNNNLMWSHYSDSHKGICVGFDTALLNEYKQKEAVFKEVLYNIYPIHYSKDFPIFIPGKLSADENNEIAIVPFTYKSIDWFYEQEYRLISLNGANKPLVLDPLIIKEIYFGTRMEWPEIDRIVEICSKVGIDTTFYQSNPKKDEYALEFKEIHQN